MVEQSLDIFAQTPEDSDFDLVGLTVVARERLMRQGALDSRVIESARILPEPAQIPIRILKPFVV